MNFIRGYNLIEILLAKNILFDQVVINEIIDFQDIIFIQFVETVSIQYVVSSKNQAKSNF